MTATGFLRFAFEWYFSGVLFVSMAIGSFLLWKRTRHPSALAQFVAAAMLLLSLLATTIRSLAGTPVDDAPFARFMWSWQLHATIEWTALTSALAFGVSYFFYAVRRNRT
jgi:hypothetical protein